MEAEAAPRATETYPVDILEDDPEGHQSAVQVYYELLREGGSAEVFSLATGEQVRLETPFLHYCTMYRDEPRHKILVLVNPQDTKTVVAVYLKESWWSVEDVLRTSDPTREGLMKVQSFGERIVLYVLNTIVFGRLERDLDDDDMFFLPHPAKEQAKILWRDGAAVGFYSIKMKGEGEGCMVSEVQGGVGRLGCLSVSADPLSMSILWTRVDQVAQLIKLLYRDSGSNLGWSGTCCAAGEDLELLVLLPPPLGCRDSKGVPPHMVYVMLGTEARALCMLSGLLAGPPATLCPLTPCSCPRGVCGGALYPKWGARGWSGALASVLGGVLSVGASSIAYSFSCLGSTVHPQGSEEDTDTPRQTSRGDGPTPVHHGESPKEWVTAEQETRDDQECVTGEEEAGMPLRPSWDEAEEKGVKRTMAAAGLVGEPWRKRVRQATSSSEVHLASPGSEPEGLLWP
ncbi:protein FAM169B [Peromyscus leucopus]|uniref:protein FAM169B n=1 Tax=Peromyscus leucopus TaxID=10041 RepID=UPI001884ECAF|nr:protein FAM169B [Peromyscus leucopus]